MIASILAPPLSALAVALISISNPLIEPIVTPEPAEPAAQQPISIGVLLYGKCFLGGQVGVDETVIRIDVRFQVPCSDQGGEVSFAVDVPGLSPGAYTIEVYEVGVDPSSPIPPFEPQLIATREVEVDPAEDGILDVDVAPTADGYVVAIAQHSCAVSIFETDSIADGIVRLRQTIPPAIPAAPCIPSDPPTVASVLLGPLEAGPHTVLIEAVNDDQRAVWLEPFTVRDPDRTVLLLRDGRFAVSVAWQTAIDMGIGLGRSLSDDSAAFWFFGPSNIELLVKVLDGCASTGHFWIFAAGLTNQGVSLTVTDTTTSAVRTYDSTLGNDFAPILDTRAIACP